MKLIKQNRGAAMIFFILFFVVVASAMTFLLSRTTGSDAYILSSLSSSKQAYITAESALEDVVMRIVNGETFSATNTLSTLLGVSTTTAIYDNAADLYRVKSIAKVGRSVRVSLVELSPGAGTAFNYGLQTGNGGFELVNSASIVGNAFSNGPINGQGSSMIYGDVISSGPSGIISEITATGSAWSNTLDDSVIEGDAYYNVVGVPSTVNGTRHTPFTVIDPEPLPIPDSEVEVYKTKILDTGTVIPSSACTAGTYTINSDTTIGNVKIECNLEIKKTGPSTVVTLTGSVWVTGNITMSSGPTIRVSPSVGRYSVQMIADNPANRLTSSKIFIGNSTQFIGSGHASSFIMLISQNNAAENGASDEAIDIGQSSNGDLILYAGHGKVDINNQIHLKSVTGYSIEIGNSSSITYDTGLTNVLFTGGPGGAYIISDWYQE
ncbi:MAG: hypothetical protein UZ19_OD1000743 [Parcubacteria bacterium OLB19]|nr:MAG: hypothetical protein UZ19_OD1000743 [Parcubacteria bacterium OLB19]